MNQPSVSVIVAAYNAEKYLERCLDSIRSQLFESFEVIIVDDGSSDKTLEIARLFCYRDSRFIVIHTENRGVASARQTGLAMANGEYTIHIDSDDFIDPEMLSEMYQLAKQDNADMVICDYSVILSSGTEYIKTQKPKNLDHRTVWGQTIHELQGSLCNRIIRRACFEKYGIRHNPSMRVCEDQYILLQLLANNIKIAYLPKPFYHYDHTQNPSSLINQGITISERLLPLSLLTKDYDLSPIQTYVDNYILFLAYEALFQPVDYCPDYKKTFSVYLSNIRRAGFPWYNKVFVILRILGIKLPLQQIRTVFRKFAS